MVCGQETHIGEDCWSGGSTIVLPSVTFVRGSTNGTGTVATRNVPAFYVIAGSPL